MSRLRALRSALRYLPTRRLAALFTLASPVWLLSTTSPGLLLATAVTGVLLLLAIADALAIPARSHITLRRTVPESVGLGDTTEAEYQLDSSWPLALGLELHDALTAAVERVAGSTRGAGLADTAFTPAAAPWRLARLIVPPRGRAVLRTGLRGRERGDHALGPVVVRVQGPLGLAARTLEYSPGGRIAIVPSIAGVRRYRLLALQHRLREAGIRTIRRRGEGTSFAWLREYVEGDDPRRMDWKASARRGKLITREFTVEQGQTVVIAIDAGRLMTQLSGEVSRFEHALASATVLADVATRSGDHVALLVFNDEVRAFVPAAKGALALRRVREAMVPLTANMTEPDYAGAFRTLAARHRKRSLIVLFTDVVDARASRAVIAHTVRSAARHLPLVVALQNDALVAAAVPAEPDATALFESAAAEELLQAREEALARMRRSGVSVLDVAPRVMTAAVVNRYLAIKARASL
jgi:uncharacterized protein (DUF58 family)